jgi:uncharacterized protein
MTIFIWVIMVIPTLPQRNKSRASRTVSSVKGFVAEGKTTIKPLAKIIQGRKKLNSPILIAGFPGAGLVGSISTSYIIDRLHMNQIACVESEFIVPGVIYAEGKLRHPFRLYSNERGDVCVLVCEAPVMIQGMYSVLDTVSKWVLYNNVREVMVLDGIAVEGLPDSKRIPIVLSSNGREADEANLINDYNIDATNKEKVDNVGSVYPTTAFVGGMSGGILSSCLSNGIASKALLIYASRGIPDPEGAAILIEFLGNIADNTSLKIDTAELRKQGAALKTRLEKIIQSYGEQQQRDQQEQVQSQTPVKDGVMYG